MAQLQNWWYCPTKGCDSMHFSTLFAANEQSPKCQYCKNEKMVRVYVEDEQHAPDA